MKSAEQRIQEAIDQRATTLDLSGLSLSVLPDSFQHIAGSLLQLDLSNNQLDQVPRLLGLCRRLKELNLASNRLITLAGLGSLTQLESLDLSGNLITSFPSEVLNISGLTRLKMVNNGLTSLPRGIEKLSALEALYLEDNLLETLPSIVAEMVRLQELTLTNNPLQTPPYEVAMSGLSAIRSYFDDLTKTSSGTGTTEEKKKYLLAIAIEEYGRAYDARPGNVKEAETLAEILRERYAFKERTTLFNEEATLPRIQHAIGELVNTVGPNDVLIIYFNGWTRDVTSETGYITYEPADFEGEEFLGMLRSMRAEHVLLIIDNHFYSSYAGATRGTSSGSGSYASRWALYRRGAEWEERFTPGLIRVLRENTLDVGVQELSDLLEIEATPLALGGDSGGEFFFMPDKEVAPLVVAVDEATNIRQKVKSYIANDKTGQALDYLQEKVNKDDVLIIKSRYRRFRKDVLSGLISDTDANLQQNRINLSLLEFLDGLRDEDVLIDQGTEAKKQDNTIYLKETAKELIANGETRQALDFLKQRVYRNELIQIDTRYHELKMEQIKGTIYQEQMNIGLNKINESLLLLINDFTDGDVLTDVLTKGKIIENIQRIETLRTQYQSTTATEQRRSLKQEMDELLSANEQLRASLEIDIEVQMPADEKVDEENVWQQALKTDTLDAYQNYIEEFPSGLFLRDARQRTSELELLQREEETVAAIRNDRRYGDIQQYLSAFPQGKYRIEVEEILHGLEVDEETLWYAALQQNNIAAYRTYQDQSKIGKYSTAALDKITQLEKEGTAGRINEAKLIFVGNGRVGKTSLSRVLADEPFNPDEPSTHGIRIVPWTIQLKDGRELKINMWDFGGQEIYHNTHRFFLTTRALYLLVWDKETLDQALANPELEENFTPSYWLNNVSLLSEKSPVLMVQNKVEQARHFLDNRNDLVQRFNVRDFVEVSAAEGRDLDRLEKLIAEQYQGAPVLSDLIGYDIPLNWLAVREALTDLAKQQPYLKYDDYLRCCEEHDLAKGSARELAHFLTEIGQLLYFPNHRSLREIVFLDPVWVTDLIYRILNNRVAEQNGRFTEADLKDNWTHLPTNGRPTDFRFRDEQEVEIFLELMRHFEVCFALDGDEPTFIAPQFLPQEPPATVVQWDTTGAYRIGFQYEFLHKSIIARAIVRLGPKSAPDHYWRHGILLQEADTEALIQADYPNQRIQVHIKGSDPEAFRKFVLQKEFREINDQLQVADLVYCSQCQAAIERAKVEQQQAQGLTDVFCEAGGHKVSIDVLLNPPKTNPSPTFFISYAAPDDAYKEEFLKWLRILNWTDKIHIWEDRQIGLGEHKDQAVLQALAEADIIVMLISIDYLDSKTTEGAEFQRALERHQQGSALIMPILIRQSPYQLTPLKDLQFAPQNGQSINASPDKDAVWTEVIERIRLQLQAKFDWGV